MPTPRPLNLKNRRRTGPAAKAPKRPRTPRRAGGGESSAPYWIAAGLLVVLILLIACYAEWPLIDRYVAALTHPAQPSEQMADHDAARALAERQAADAMVRHLQEKAAAEKRQAEAERAAKEKAAKEKAAEEAAAKAAPTPEPSPVVQPAPLTRGNYPARALPLDANVLTTERIAAYQVALERMHFSCGFIDGNQGMRTQRMLRAFQQSRGLPVTGFLDPATRAAIGEPGEPFLNYTVTAADVASIMPKPTTWRAKSQVARLGYNDIWELLAEKFHCTRAYLKELNRDVPQPVAGSDIIGPKVYPAAPYPHAASLRVNLGETSIEALDASGRIVAFFPCSIAADKNKRPNGTLTVKSVVPDPDYTFDPALFKDAAAREGLTHKMTLPPGPRNPVGTAWIGLSLPGYGIHGTPEPENISRTQSHGCFRLANWNAEKVLRMVRVGTPVDVEP
jgi:lipoprotein-anchoring transpeptidase ErfK/SrfK